MITRCLLDTHAFLWWVTDDSRLGADARALLANPRVGVFVSAATVWEISIKVELGKLDFQADPVDEISANGMWELPITARHAAEAGRLPKHHRDPFDRVLVAQARHEQLPLVSRDARLQDYDVELVF